MKQIEFDRLMQTSALENQEEIDKEWDLQSTQALLRAGKMEEDSSEPEVMWELGRLMDKIGEVMGHLDKAARTLRKLDDEFSNESKQLLPAFHLSQMCFMTLLTSNFYDTFHDSCLENIAKPYNPEDSAE